MADKDEGAAVATLDEAQRLITEDAAAAGADAAAAAAGGTAAPAGGAAAADLYNQRLDGERVPENLRGRSVGEMIDFAIRRDEALRISENARQDLLRVAGQPRSAERPPVEQPKILTKDELNALFSEDPAAAMEYMVNLRGGQLVAHVDRRLDGLSHANVNTAEAYAREKYKDEFAMFGPQITAFIEGVDDKSAFGNRKAWDDLVSYVRGIPENFEKLIETRMKRGTADVAETARGRERAATGFVATSTRRAPALDTGESEMELDPTAREIAEKLGSFNNPDGSLNMKEYLKWSRMGG